MTRGNLYVTDGWFHGTQGNDTVIAVPPYITTSLFCLLPYIASPSFSLSLSLSLSSLLFSLSLFLSNHWIASSPVVVIHSHLKAYDRHPRSSAPLRLKKRWTQLLVIVSSSTKNYYLKRGNAHRFSLSVRSMNWILLLYKSALLPISSSCELQRPRLRRSTLLLVLPPAASLTDIVGRAAVTASFGELRRKEIFYLMIDCRWDNNIGTCSMWLLSVCSARRVGLLRFRWWIRIVLPPPRTERRTDVSCEG